MVIGSPWQLPVPQLKNDAVVVREIQTADEQHIFPLLRTEMTRRFYSPPPRTMGEFRRFILRSRQMHVDGDAVCLVCASNSTNLPIGLFQLRRLPGTVHIAEWGFLLDPQWWSTGVFMQSAGLVLDYAFSVIELERLEARVVVENRRANVAMAKIGAVPEGVLRGAFRRGDQHLDSVLWSILRDDWRRVRTTLPREG